MTTNPTGTWTSGEAYERYIGRWSRKVAEELVSWLAPRAGLAWGDVGCGTGALASTILSMCEPATVSGVDASETFVAVARRSVDDPRARFEVGEAAHLPWGSGSLDVTVSGLVLNFVADPAAMAREMARVTRAGGVVAAYVWDYGGEMEMMRRFWDAAIAVNPADAKLDQAERYPVCAPGPLTALFERAGLTSVAARAIDIGTVFASFDDYWSPFLGKSGTAPLYLAAVDEDVRQRIRELLRARLEPRADGTIRLRARAWAVRGVAG